jgi:hypothetical protein
MPSAADQPDRRRTESKMGKQDGGERTPRGAVTFLAGDNEYRVFVDGDGHLVIQRRRGKLIEKAAIHPDHPDTAVVK